MLLVLRTWAVGAVLGAEEGTDHVVAGDIDLEVDTVPGEQPRRVADTDCATVGDKVAAAEDRDYDLGEGVDGGSQAAEAAGHTGLEGGSPDVDHNLEEVLVEGARSPVAADNLGWDIDLVAVAADSLAGPHTGDSHLGVDRMTS